MTDFLSALNVDSFAITVEMVTAIASGSAAVITPIGVILASYWAYKSKQEAKEAKEHSKDVNEAVNFRHPEEPRLLDRVRATQDMLETVSANVYRVERKIDTHINDHMNASLIPRAEYEG